MKFRRYLSLLVTAILLNSALFGAGQAPAAPAQLPITEKLKVLVLQGQGAASEIERMITPLTVVEVRDEFDRPVEGAEVIFRLPASGAGGGFSGGKTSQTTRTDNRGQAAMTGFVPNATTGSFQIMVTVMAGNQMGKATITQSNVRQLSAARPVVEKEKKSWLRRYRWPLVAAAAAGIGAGVYFGTRSKAPTITITPGTPGFGGPQ